MGQIEKKLHPSSPHSAHSAHSSNRIFLTTIKNKLNHSWVIRIINVQCKNYKTNQTIGESLWLAWTFHGLSIETKRMHEKITTAEYIFWMRKKNSRLFFNSSNDEANSINALIYVWLVEQTFWNRNIFCRSWTPIWFPIGFPVSVPKCFNWFFFHIIDYEDSRHALCLPFKHSFIQL